MPKLLIEYNGIPGIIVEKPVKLDISEKTFMYFSRSSNY